MTDTARRYLFTAWVLSLLALLGSLYFSEVMGLPPCLLCWYQRIAMYPLVAILATGFLIEDSRVTTYAWPFVVLGGLIAVYHNLLFYGVIPESISPCTGGVSCTTPQLTGLGFVSIPLLSLLGFAVVGSCLVLCKKGRKETA